jgi:DNA-binding winged helix-turn-helix (wHTH) protein
MAIGALLRFGPYSVDPVRERLWKGGESLHLTPKSLSVLLHLIRERPRVVTKDELLDDVWRNVHVGEAVLKVAVREIRHVLGDDARHARYVETAHRQGYRFVAPVDVAGEWRLDRGPTVLVGRSALLDALASALEHSMTGHRQVVFVSGEGGIGKTSAVEAFLEDVERSGRAAVGRGQCVERITAPEPYHPILDAVGRLLKQPCRAAIEEALRTLAPTWVAQLPLLDDGAGEALRREILGATSGRMLREIAETLEDITRRQPLVLFVDDLHWADAATIDFVSLVARRPEASRLLIVLAYRPSDGASGPSALRAVRHELVARGLARDVALEFLTTGEVETYLRARFAGHVLPDGFAAFVRDHTDGNPLFMTQVLDHLVAHGALDRSGGRWALTRALGEIAGIVPDSLRQLVDATVERLSVDERRTLEAASVCGVDFAASAVAAALDIEDASIEGWLDRLVSHRHFLRGTGTDRLPDGTWSPRYAFTHALFQHVLYQRIPVVSRMRLHLKIAGRGETVYGAAVDGIAGELALHWERGGDHRKAVAYLRIASANAVRRFANREAASCLEHALSLSQGSVDEDGWATERLLHEEVGHVRRSMGDMRGASAAFLASAALSDAHGHAESAVESLLLAASALSWVDRLACLAVAAQAEARTAHLDAGLERHARGYTAYWRLLWDGWRAEDARECETALSTAPAGDPGRRASLHWRGAFGRLLTADYDGARRAARVGADLALGRGDVFGRLVAQFYRAWAGILAGEWGEADLVCRESVTNARRNEHRQWESLFQALRAWLLRSAGDAEGATTVAREGLTEARTAGFPFGELLAGLQLGLSLLEHGQVGEARAELDALDQRLTSERLLMGWSWRIPLDLGLADLARLQGRRAEAETRARAVCQAAAQCGERTWLALASLTLAETLFSSGVSGGDGCAALTRACELAASGRAPTAALRVWARASRLAAAQGDAAGAARFAAELQTVAAGLVRSLGAGSPIARHLAEPEGVLVAAARP